MAKILLIEDDQWLASLEQDVLQSAGYMVRSVHNALDAIAAVDEELPDIIIADVLLAGSTVFALLHELQSYHDTGAIPVILWTSIAEQFSVKQLSSYGVKKVIDKTTMDADALVVALKSVEASV